MTIARVDQIIDGLRDLYAADALLRPFRIEIGGEELLWRLRVKQRDYWRALDAITLW